MKTIAWGKEWEVNNEQKYIKLHGNSPAEKQAAVDQMLTAEREKGSFNVLKKWTGERFAIFGPHREVIVTVERSASTLLGIATYGVQLIAYCEKPEGLFVWAARRSATKTLFPNCLTVTVGGSLPAGETPLQCLIRESDEEASLPGDLIRSSARAAGTISYVTASETKTTSGGEAGLIRAEVQYIYDMKVGPDVVPKPNDQEAAGFDLYSMDQIKEAIEAGEFSPGNACFYLDFFIRHGLTTYENEENYVQIIARLHRSLGIQTA